MIRPFPKPEPRKARAAKKRALHRMDMSGIRLACLEREGGVCAVEGCGSPGVCADHWEGGSGRRRQRQSVETVWMLCRTHDRRRTHNDPDAEWWNRERAGFCAKHGYPYRPHIVHEELPETLTSTAPPRPSIGLPNGTLIPVHDCTRVRLERGDVLVMKIDGIGTVDPATLAGATAVLRAEVADAFGWPVPVLFLSPDDELAVLQAKEKP